MLKSAVYFGAGKTNQPVLVVFRKSFSILCVKGHCPPAGFQGAQLVPLALKEEGGSGSQSSYPRPTCMAFIDVRCWARR